MDHQLPFRPAAFASAPRVAGDGTPPTELWFLPAAELDEGSLALLNAVLTPAEQARSAKYLRADDRRNSAVARGFLRLQLARWTGRDARELEIVADARGKPYLAASSEQPVPAFNVSHSGTGVLLGISDLPAIGVDLEDSARRVLDDIHSIAGNFFAAGEARILRELAPPLQRRAFFDCWTRKEAFLKLLGDGLSRELNSFEVELRPGVAPQLRQIAALPGRAPETPADFQMYAGEPEPEHIVACCLPAHPPESRQIGAFRWNGRFR